MPRPEIRWKVAEHTKVLALTAALGLVGLLLEAPPFCFGETEVPGRNEMSAGEMFRRGRPARPCPPPLGCRGGAPPYPPAGVWPRQRTLPALVPHSPGLPSGFTPAAQCAMALTPYSFELAPRARREEQS